MSDLIRDAPIGQIIRWITKNKVLQYPEEKDDWECPPSYQKGGSGDSTPGQTAAPPTTEKSVERKRLNNKEVEQPESDNDSQLDEVGLAKLETIRSNGHRNSLSRVGSTEAIEKARTQADLERALSDGQMERGPSIAITPTRLDDGTILVDWYSTDDPENPQNWSLKKKSFVALQIYLYTFAVYMGSSIYAPSSEGVVHRFGVSIDAASLGLSMYVLAYGLGPMLWSPLSEMPLIGRNPPYILTFAIFTILCLPTALVDNFAGLIVLRFLQGFFGSPCLATGGASLGDLFSLIKLPYAISLWALAATCGPALGPIISGFSVQAENWRWSLWEMLWLAGPVWILLFLCLPETYGPNILLRRARRLRARTGEDRLKSQSEIDQGNMKVAALVLENLWRPNQMMVLDPAVGFTALYTALAYGIYYSFFEAFPIVYVGFYGFNLGQMGLTFLSITVGVIISLVIYWSWIYWVSEPDMIKNGFGAPERRLIPALWASTLLPVGLFMFAWTADRDIHWIVSVIGIGIFTVGIFIVMQCIFLYLPFTYPQYAASLFAGNDLTRSTLAAGAIHFSRPLYINLGIGRGTSLLAGFTVGCVGGVWALWYWGDKLRARIPYLYSRNVQLGLSGDEQRVNLRLLDGSGGFWSGRVDADPQTL
ncbi:MFS general substrate transporter [Patellaria atrata CBS 101060]|uniref:MFS general substrate transporter n=1 Tax=Patellaria atrata CBS 101060 TaxID=1346257 RepID=A0A9P4VU42_9PEZI|nr:MFS general substrate transporter [Patellaria atrata CBS 101060]